MAEDLQGQTCFHIACSYNKSSAMLEWLVQRMCDQETPEKTEAKLVKRDSKCAMTCLHKAIANGNLKLVQKLASPERFRQTFGQFADGAAISKELLQARCFNDRTCLHLAVAMGKKKIVQCVLEAMREHGLESLVQARLCDGRTVAHSAASFGRLEVLKIVYEWEETRQAGDGKKLLATLDDDGWTCLHWVADSASAGQPVLEGNLVLKNAKRATLDSQASLVDFTCRMMNDRPDFLLGQEKKRGRTALHLATRNGSDDLVVALLNNAAALGEETLRKLLGTPRADGLLPAHGAASKGRKKPLKIIYEMGGIEALLPLNAGVPSCLFESLASVWDMPGVSSRLSFLRLESFRSVGA